MCTNCIKNYFRIKHV